MGRAHDDEFRDFVSARSARLLRTAYLLVGDRGRAEDLLQSALVKTYLAWTRIAPGAVEAYARRVMTTTVVSWWRSRSAPERLTSSPPDLGVADRSATFIEADRMRQHLLALPAKQRAVLVLRYYDDLSEAEVADALGISRGTVSSHTARGLATLRTRIREEAGQR